MSEIKGQLLGMLIVLSIFVAIGVTLVGAFQTNASSIAKDLNSETIIQAVNVLKTFRLR